MDFQKIADSIGGMTCILSVEQKENGGWGDIRIVAGNAAYVNSIEHPMEGLHLPEFRFQPNQLYTAYIPRDLNFEQFCYHAAVERKCMHAYAHPERFDFWMNMIFLPIVSESEDPLCYCTYTMELSDRTDASQMADLSSDVYATVLESLIKIRAATDFKEAMTEVVDDVRSVCAAKRCCILLLEPVSRTCSVLCESLAEDFLLKPISDIVDDDFYRLMETWEETISGSSCLVVTSPVEMEIVRQRNPKWYESLKTGNVHSLILFPIKAQQELLGYIWITNFDSERAVRAKEILETTTFILGAEIANYQLLERLRMLSSRDMLTGVLNRNQMNQYVDQLSEGRAAKGHSVGIVFADLNDLKLVNDREGHDRGDLMLQNAADALRKVFPTDEIYRAGGDEFTVISVGVSEEELAEKTEQLRAATAVYDRVSFSVGWHVEADAANVRIALRKADENMYEDKKQYHAAHPKGRR